MKKRTLSRLAAAALCAVLVLLSPGPQAWAAAAAVSARTAGPVAGVPVVPAGIRGTYEALRDRWGYVPRRHPLSVRFGAPRCFSPDGLRGRRSNRLAVTQRVMDEIAALLT